MLDRNNKPNVFERSMFICSLCADLKRVQSEGWEKWLENGEELDIVLV